MAFLLLKKYINTLSLLWIMVVTDSQVKDIFKALNLNVNKISKINTFANFLLKVKTDRGNYFLKI